jgi:hypothetical protein
MGDVPGTRYESSTLGMHLDIAPSVHAADEQVIWTTGVASFDAEATQMSGHGGMLIFEEWKNAVKRMLIFEEFFMTKCLRRIRHVNNIA